MEEIKTELSSRDKDSHSEDVSSILKLQWKEVDLNDNKAMVPKWSESFKKEIEWQNELRNERMKSLEGQCDANSLKSPPVKTEDQIEAEKIINRANSTHKVISHFDTPPSSHEKDLKSQVVVTERYPREIVDGLSERDLEGKDDLRKQKGELTAMEIIRWKRLSRREAVYSLTRENFDRMRRLINGERAEQNPNYEQIRSRIPKSGFRERSRSPITSCGRPRSPTMYRDRPRSPRMERNRSPLPGKAEKNPNYEQMRSRRPNSGYRERSRSPIMSCGKPRSPTMYRDRSRSPRMERNRY